MIEAWKDDSCARTLKNKTVYANYNNYCYKYRAENGVTVSTDEDQFFSSHKEADNRMFFISIMLYQETQLLCELMTPTLW